MKIFKLFLSLSFIGLLVAVAMPQPTAQAATMITFSITNITVGATCDTSVWNVNFDALADREESNFSGFDRWGYIAYDGNGVPISADWTGDDLGFARNRDNTFGNGDIINNITARPITLVLIDTDGSLEFGTDTQLVYDSIEASYLAGEPVLATIIYDPADDVPACASLPLIGAVVDDGLDDYGKIGQVKVSAPGSALYESAGGGVVRDAAGQEIWIPNPTAYDPSQDTYDVISQQTIDGQVWVEIFVGNALSTVWLPVGGAVSPIYQ